MSILQIAIATTLALVALFTFNAGAEYRLGIRLRRLGARVGLDWSTFARWGWEAEDRRREKMR